MVFRGGSETTTESPKSRVSPRKARQELSRKEERERRYLPQTARLGRQTPPGRQKKEEGQQRVVIRRRVLGAMCVEGGGYVACYICSPLFKEIAGPCGGERSTLLRQSRYRRHKANRDQTGIKCGERGPGVGLGKGFKRLLQKGSKKGQGN